MDPIIIEDDLDILKTMPIRTEDYRYYFISNPDSEALAELDKIRQDAKKRGQKHKARLLVWRYNIDDPSIQQLAWKKTDKKFLGKLKKIPENWMTHEEMKEKNKKFKLN